MIKDKALKLQLFKLYTYAYRDLEFYQKNTAETIRNTITSDMNSNFRWSQAFNNDTIETTSIKLKNTLVYLNDDWL